MDAKSILHPVGFKPLTIFILIKKLHDLKDVLASYGVCMRRERSEHTVFISKTHVSFRMSCIGVALRERLTSRSIGFEEKPYAPLFTRTRRVNSQPYSACVDSRYGYSTRCVPGIWISVIR